MWVIRKTEAASALGIGPPPLADVAPFFFLSEFPELESGVPQYTVKDAAAVVFAVGVPLVGEVEHLLRQLQGLGDVLVTGFHDRAPQACPQREIRPLPYAERNAIAPSAEKLIYNFHAREDRFRTS
jgi:hypothetical protein